MSDTPDEHAPVDESEERPEPDEDGSGTGASCDSEAETKVEKDAASESAAGSNDDGAADSDDDDSDDDDSGAADSDDDDSDDDVDDVEDEDEDAEDAEDEDAEDEDAEDEDADADAADDVEDTEDDAEDADADADDAEDDEDDEDDEDEGPAAPADEPDRRHPSERKLPPLVEQERPGRESGEPLTLRRMRRLIVEAGGLVALATAHWRRLAKTSVIALVLFTTAYTSYALFSWNRYDEPSDATHFVYLAHTFNQCLAEKPPYEESCTFEMMAPPPHGNDWATYIELPVKGGETLKGIWLNRKAHKFKTLDGQLYIIEPKDMDRTRRQTTRHFVSFPPGPAILMMPFIPDVESDEVDLRDPKKLGLNDVKFTIIFAALNVVLLFFLLQRLTAFGVSTRKTWENLVLTGVYALGTNVLWCSVMGGVWFTALVVGATFTLLYMMAAIDTRHPLLAGFFLACAMACRTPLAFSFVFFGWFLLFPDGRIRRRNWGELFWKGALFSVPILIVGGCLMYMNYVRFENPFEFGHTYLAHGQLHRIQRYGLFNYHFLSKNLFAAFAMLPRVQSYPPYFIFSKHGMSLFLSTPVFLYFIAYRSGWRQLDRKWFWGAWLTVAAIAIPGFFYQNTGWAQYGFRFSLDYTPYLIVLLALNRRRIGVLFCILALFGFAVNAFGAVSFGRMPEMYQEWMIDPDR